MENMLSIIMTSHLELIKRTTWNMAVLFYLSRLMFYFSVCQESFYTTCMRGNQRNVIIICEEVLAMQFCHVGRGFHGHAPAHAHICNLCYAVKVHMCAAFPPGTVVKRWPQSPSLRGVTLYSGVTLQREKSMLGELTRLQKCKLQTDKDRDTGDRLTEQPLVHLQSVERRCCWFTQSDLP